MKKLGMILIGIGVAMISYGVGWIIGIKAVDAYTKEICNNTSDISWYYNHNCMRFYEETK